MSVFNKYLEKVYNEDVLGKRVINESKRKKISSQDMCELIGGKITGWDIIEDLGDDEKARKIIESKRWNKKYERYKDIYPDEDLTPLKFLDRLDEEGKFDTELIIARLMKLSTPEEIQRTYDKFDED